MRLGLITVASLLATTTTLSALAQQQPWLKDRRLGEGMGILAGDLELHPGLAAEFGYDSNYFQRAGDGTPEEEVIDALRLRATASLSMTTVGSRQREGALGAPPRVVFESGVYASYNELIALQSEHADRMSDQRHVDAGAEFKLQVLPQRPFSFDMYGNFVRTVEPNNTNPVEENAFDRDSFRIGAGLTWRPGGGLFEWRGGYDVAFHLFEQAQWQEFNNLQHTISTRGRWRWLPRSAFLYDGRYAFIRYSGETMQNDGEHVRWLFGHAGLITKHFAHLALVGWGATFYEERDTGQGIVQARNYDGLLAQAEVKWFLLPQPTLEDTSASVGLSSIALGYVRDFGNSYLGSFYQRDRFYGKASYFLGGVLLLALEGGFAFVNYPQTFWPNGDPRASPLTETRIDVGLFGEYRLSDIFALNATVRYDQNISRRNYAAARDPAGAITATENLEFSRWRAFLGARLFW